jgi:hypothetical protein
MGNSKWNQKLRKHTNPDGDADSHRILERRALARSFAMEETSSSASTRNHDSHKRHPDSSPLVPPGSLHRIQSIAVKGTQKSAGD